MTMEDNIVLTTNELQILSELDSRQFGFIKLTEEAHAAKKTAALKAIQYLERVIVQANIHERKRNQPNDGNNNEKSRYGFSVEPKTYTKLGHLHLLLGDYSKALSAYQKYFRITRNHWKDPSFLYGLGLVYYHYNAFPWAQKAFEQALYVEPSFSRANEIHLRLGIIAKMKSDFETSLKHFRMAQNDSSSCTLSDLEIQFHVAHLYEVCGHHEEARQRYDSLLTNPALPTQLRADIFRQIGWMYHAIEELGDKSYRVEQAVLHLQKSIEADPKSGQSLYLLGRCYASIGKVHDAFIAYRNSVDKSESNADTWCSIGVLYQQQNQPMDALQAYICAVQLDKDHSAAWTNLGILYESQSHPQDALACYMNATRNKSCGQNLHQRIKYLKNQLPAPPTTTTPSKPRALPSVEEAWNLPISNEMTNRQNQPRQAGARVGQPGGLKKEDGMGVGVGVVAAQPRPHFYLNQQQLQTLQYLQNNQPGLNPQQQQALQQLQHQFRLMQQHQQQMRLQAQQQQQVVGLPRPVQPQGQYQGPPAGAAGGSQPAAQAGVPAELDGLNVSDKELESLISQQDIGSFAESLLKQFQEQIGDTLGEETANQASTIKTEADGLDGKADIKPDTNDLLAALVKAAGGHKEDFCEESLKQSGLMEVDHLDIPTSVEVLLQESYPQPELNIKMTAEEIVEACNRCLAKNGRISGCLLGDDQPPPCPPERPATKLTKEQLLPPTPSVYLENKKDACSPQLQEFCLQHPITVVRGIAAALKLDLGLFSTKQLVEAHPEHPVHVRTQVKQSSDENWDGPGQQSQVWVCTSQQSVTTVAAYAKYQVATFQEAFQQEQDKTTSSSSQRTEEELPGRKRKKSMPTLKHGYCVDLSVEHKFRCQLQELMKLPPWTKVVSAGNMLSHIGYPVLGMNTVRMSMKVPGARSPARQETNNFCSVNINIGPGDCEWFGVPEDYWGAVHELCEKNGVNFLRGSWWPIMKDLMDAEIPVYRFLQRPGDLVWVNSGCIHWVQAVGWSNNIEWNVGPLTHRQYSLALERYEWNKLQSFKSAVAMIYLSWNLAKNVRVSDAKLFEAIKHTLMRSLRQLVLTTEFVKWKGLEMKFHGRSRSEPGRSEPAHYCIQCEVEVFGILFIREQEKKHVVHCLDCARRHSPDLKGFVILEEYHLKELKDVYNNFKLANPNPHPVHGGVQRPFQQTHGSGQLQLQTAAGQAAAAAAAAAAAHSSTHKSPLASSSHPLISSGMMGSLSQMTPQQQLAIQQALQQQALLNP